MYRTKQQYQPFNILFDNGGLGDSIAWLPALKYIYDQHPHTILNVWIPDYFLQYAQSCLKGTESRIRLFKWSEKDKYELGHPTRSFAHNIYTNLGAHMTEHAFQILVNTQPDDKNDYNYLKPDLKHTKIDKYNLPQKYVVVTTGYTSDTRVFLPQYINEITTYLNNKGYTPVFLGKTATTTGSKYVIKGSFATEINYSAGINLIDKTNLFEATKVLQNSTAVIGLDNGILHLAGCLDVPIVGGFTTVKPEHRMPYRNGILGQGYYPVVPPESLKCRFCQSNWQFTINHNFTNCYYGDFQCTLDLKSEFYIKELEKILL
jgi:ADP-heptose:LPS heptosyltransferase